jgi:putative F0F1-ATPase subunit (Ca2+/Mg2+ transporter)
MRHLRPPLRPPSRVEPDDSVVQGMEAAFALALFLGLGFVIDRWLDTSPLFTIGLLVLGAVGVFLRFKYAYLARMDRLEADRRNGSRLASRTAHQPGSNSGSSSGSERVA